MRLGLIGAVMHWQTYAPALKTIPDLELVAVAPAGPEETTRAFDKAPGITDRTRRYDDAKRLLDEEKLDIVQVCPRPHRIARWTEECLTRGLPVVAEKPLAMEMRELERLHTVAIRTRTPFVPMHTQRGEAVFAAMARAVRRGDIGEPMVAFSQKTYKWGKSREDYYRSRATFPGIAPYIGIHALDWLTWMLGDVFTEVFGYESAAARPDYPACASQAAYTFRMKNGGAAALTLDYLRPSTAPTHGDERVRIAGTKGVIEAALIEEKVSLIVEGKLPVKVPLEPMPDIFTAFVRHLRGQGSEVLSRYDAFRITEIALKAQQAVDTKKAVSLTPSAFA